MWTFAQAQFVNNLHIGGVLAVHPPHYHGGCDHLTNRWPMTDSSPQWPDRRAALDEALDVPGVLASTGCTAEDLADLNQIFLQEVGNMVKRLEQAQSALEGAMPGAALWPQACEKLRTAAHELTTSFGIVGAKRAETYSRATQLKLRKSAPAEEALPTAEDLRTAAQALLEAVRRVESLIRQQP